MPLACCGHSRVSLHWFALICTLKKGVRLIQKLIRKLIRKIFQERNLARLLASVFAEESILYCFE
jgi:hypothetical protein